MKIDIEILSRGLEKYNQLMAEKKRIEAEIEKLSREMLWDLDAMIEPKGEDDDL